MMVDDRPVYIIDVEIFTSTRPTLAISLKNDEGEINQAIEILKEKNPDVDPVVVEKKINKQGVILTVKKGGENEQGGPDTSA